MATSVPRPTGSSTSSRRPGCTVWQVLPLVPTHEADRSPYNALSAMAGSPELISGELRAERGLSRSGRPDAEQRAASRTGASSTRDWLEPYVEFMALRDLLDHAPWPTWEPRPA